MFHGTRVWKMENLAKRVKELKVNKRIKPIEFITEKQ